MHMRIKNPLRLTMIGILMVGLLFGSMGIVYAAGALASIEVSPSFVIMAVGSQREFSVVGKDGQGNTVALIAPQVQGTGGTMTVNHDPATSTTTVTYTAGQQTGDYYFEIWDDEVTNPPGSPKGIWGSADITTVRAVPPVLASIDVTPSPVTLNKGEQ